MIPHSDIPYRLGMDFPEREGWSLDSPLRENVVFCHAASPPLSLEVGGYPDIWFDSSFPVCNLSTLYGKGGMPGQARTVAFPQKSTPKRGLRRLSGTCLLQALCLQVFLLVLRESGTTPINHSLWFPFPEN